MRSVSFLLGLVVSMTISLGIVWAHERYDRDEFGGWLDFDNDCQDTRQEVLIRNSLKKPIMLDDCRVLRGEWFDPYTGTIYTDPANVHIDHRVALKEAWEGRVKWTELERRVFANEMDNLLVVGAGVNMKKSAKPPHQWMPRQEHGCAYLMERYKTQRKWDIRPTWEEAIFVINYLEMCDVNDG